MSDPSQKINHAEDEARTLFLPTSEQATLPSEAATVIQSSDPVTAARDPEAQTAGKTIGPYHLGKKIGEGGMGLVYEAEQFEPIRRTVALKMVKRGMATEEFIARFESERRALAVMDHPSIARVLDAGATDEGQPYFVMEYVDGIPLNQYCDQNKLKIRARLELFIKVCEGVQHAHQKAIIHRDLKPGNVLVTTIDGQPIPKIIDFGVAKVLDNDVLESTMNTGAGQLIGTPEYMSPEQAEFDNAAIDTTTDVYALGVLLYELLVGQLPFSMKELKDKGFHEVLRIIKEVDPPRPSSRLKTLASLPESQIATVALVRSSAPQPLLRQLGGDLDWITMKALEKDKQRRYATANALAMDIRRHLAFEPVRACPPSRTYRIRKFARRNRIWVSAASFVLLAIIMGIAGTTTGMLRAWRAENLARQEAQTAQEVSNFLVDLFEVSDPDQARGSTITAREILDQGAQRVETDLTGQPQTRARLMKTIGKVYQNLGLFEEAGDKLAHSLEIQKALPEIDEVTLASSLADLADLYIDLARYDEAEVMLNQALELMENNQVDNSLQLAQSMGELASVYRRQGRYDEAAPLYQRTRTLLAGSLGPDDPLVAKSDNSLAILNYQRGNYSEAEILYKRALATWRRAYGNDHSDIAKGLNNLALLYHHQNQFEEALPLYQEAAAIYEKVLGPDHPRLATNINNLALVYQETGRYAQAEPLYRRALAIREASLGPQHPDVAQTLNNLGNLHREKNEYDQADEYFHRALAIRRESLGPDHPNVAWSLRDLGLLHHEKGEGAQARACFQEAVNIFIAALGTDHPDLEEIYADYATVLRENAFITEADSLDSLSQSIARKNAH